MIPWAIVPDVVEYDELKKGRRREGLFYGGTTFSYKLASAAAIYLASNSLDWIGYVPNALQSAETISGIKMTISIIPAVLITAAAVLSMRYPLTAEKHATDSQRAGNKKRASRKNLRSSAFTGTFNP